MYVSNDGASKYMKQKWSELNGERWNHVKGEGEAIKSTGACSPCPPPGS